MRIRKLDQLGFAHHIIAPALVITLVAIIGVHVLAQSHADNVTTSVAPPANAQLASISTTEVALRWAPTKNTGVTYTILRNGTAIGSTDNYTGNYLDTGLTPNTTYTYTIIAQKGHKVSVPSAAIRATTGSSTTPISSCGAKITSGGNYVLTGSLTAKSNTCVTIQNTSNVSLDCKNNSIGQLSAATAPNTLVSVNHVTNLMLVNCRLSDIAYVLSMQNDKNILLENDTFTGFGAVSATSNNGTVLSNDTFNNSSYQEYSTNRTYVGDSTLSYDNTATTQAALISICGNHNIIDNNKLNGYGSYTNNTYSGEDDGILFNNGSDSSFVNNNIQNVWDTGIETGGFISNSLFSNNTINKAYVSGIGGWDNNSWLNNTVVGNTDSNSEGLFRFNNQGGLEEGQTVLYFKNNNFSNNTETSPVPAAINSDSSEIDMSYEDNSQIPAGSVVASNNVFTDNHFDTTQSAPILWPASMIVDGGKNICGLVQFNEEAQLKCTQ